MTALGRGETDPQWLKSMVGEIASRADRASGDAGERMIVEL
jgi:hypothetical protein